MESEKFCLRWNDFETNISAGFRELRNEKDFFDVTLACDDSQLQAHKVILSACSPFFRNVLRRNPHQHPLLYLKGVKYTELQSVLNFMYLGEVNVAQEELNSFLSVAEDLKVKGLTQNSTGEGSTKTIPKPDTFKQTNRPRIATATVPPKRIRIDPPPTPVPARNYQQELDIEEVVHVKSEPRETQSQSIINFQQQQQQHDDLVPEEDHDQGTVALDESYSVNDGYEYQYEEAYEDGTVGIVEGQGGGFGGSTDLESVIQSKMSKNTEGEWQCNDCFKTSKVKTNIFEHIEAAHVESPGYECEICYKVYRTRNSFRKHKNVNHKAVTNVQQHF